MNTPADLPRPTDAGVYPVRHTIDEGCRALRIGRALLYQRIKSGALKVQKDGRRTYITPAELQRYVNSLNSDTPASASAPTA